MAILVAFVSGSCGMVPTNGATFPPADEQALVEIIEKGISAQRQPGLNVGIWVPGRGSLVRSFGTSNLESGAPMRLDDHFRIASITKTFTAVAVLQLVDRGRLGLDETLSTYVAGVSNGDRITIRNLLGMTSGIYDFTSDARFLEAFTEDPLMPFSPQDVLAIIARHEPDFAPGLKVSYSDTNYILLGMIIEEVTGEPVEEVIAAEILEPLGLDGTSFPTDPTMPEPLARGYYAGEDGKGPFKDYTATNPAVAWTAGAMISTLEDLRTWATALVTGTLLEPGTHAEQIRFGSIVTEPLSIGYGLGIGNFGGLIGHNGAIFGYSTAMFSLPEAGAVIVLEGNQASNFSNAATDIAVQLAQYLFPGAIK